MSAASTITLLVNGLTLALALGFLIIVLWHDARKQLNQFFAVFLFLVTLWNVGSLVTLAVSLIDPTTPVIKLPISIMELGFTGSSIGVYALTAVIIGIHTRRFGVLAFSSLTIVAGYQIILIMNDAPIPFEALGDGFFKYRFQPLSALFYLVFDGTTFYLVWRYQRKIRSYGLIVGLNAFVLGQSLGFLNPELRTALLSVNIASLAALLISFAILRQEIITPLAERISQVEAVHKVSLAITSQIAIDTVLDEIATQAVGWLSADAAGIFLNRGSDLELATVHNLPRQFIHARIQIGEGVAGAVAKTCRTIHLENYARDWKGTPDLPMAQEVFGSVISVPLIYGGGTIGVLMVIAGRHGRLLERGDVELLELLGAQAAVAITHSHLFEEQRGLTRQVEAARSQLETVLSSTENPVIAIDRQFKIIFANPAARNLYPTRNIPGGQPITQIFPSGMFPPDYRRVMRQLRRNRGYVYEITLNEHTYLCHLAQLERPRAVGWVAILNDVTQLKELDRIKSEMVRMTSHDLKNPLQAAMANLDLLSEDLTGIANSEVQKSLSNIHKQLQRMHRIISGILDLERVKSGMISRELCRPNEITDNALEELRHLAEEQGVALKSVIADNVPQFWGDQEQFERALINLVENGIKFTPTGGEVKITVDYRDSKIIFKVEDNGIGIPYELQTQVFDRFLRGAQKGQKGAEHITGSGLGLSLVKTIVENHQGKIWLVSEVSKGTTFYITLPPVTELPAATNSRSYRETHNDEA